MDGFSRRVSGHEDGRFPLRFRERGAIVRQSCHLPAKVPEAMTMIPIRFTTTEARIDTSSILPALGFPFTRYSSPMMQPRGAQARAASQSNGLSDEAVFSVLIRVIRRGKVRVYVLSRFRQA